jgi:Tfp pilus assembly protein PilV
MIKKNRITGKNKESGSLLLESLVAITVLLVGLGGLLILMVSSLYANNRSKGDTSATMVAEHVLEQISAQQSGSGNPIQITDCAGTTTEISTLGAPLNNGNSANGGNGANLTPAGQIDWTQAFSAIPTDTISTPNAVYAFRYVACGTGGQQITYDVRWNITWMSGYTTPLYTQGTVYSQVVVISARPIYSSQVGGLRFSIPANLSTVQGM